MILRITNRCTMGCNHCMIDSTPDGSHMNDLVFEQCLKFIDRINPIAILVTGGEPTLHPNIVEWVNRLKYPGRGIILTSNGLFLDDNSMVRKIRSLSTDVFFQVQITNDARYYPKRIHPIKYPNFAYIDEVLSLANHGRAKQNKLPIARLAPFCFNIRSISRSNYGVSLKQTIKILEAKAKFCQPSINCDGTICAGESSDCHIIGSVYDSDETILNNLQNMKCNKCGSMDNISAYHRSCVE